MKKFISILLVLLLAVGIMPINVFADSLYPEIYKDEVNVRVGSTIYTTFTYGSTATSASLVASNGNIDASIEGNMLKIYGANEGFSFITLYFNDGRNDTIKVNIVRSGKNSYDESIEVVKNRYKNISIDMTPYNATNATVSYDSSKLSVNKSSFSSSGVLRITGKNTGYSVVKITYNTGEIEIYNVTVTEKEVDSHSLLLRLIKV